MILLILTASLSCRKVNFSSTVEKSEPGVVAPSGTAIQCEVYLNDKLQTLTITLPGTNPTVTAKCTPEQVTYTWTATRNDAPVSVNGLQGAVSTPDLTALGAGTYRITLRASAQNYTDFTNEKSPLVVTINNGGMQPQPAVSCDPKINGSLTSLTLNAGTPNPQINANCMPPDASCAWNVTRDGMPRNVSGLSSCTATADFTNQEPGTYLIYLTATRPNYTPYTTMNPLTVTVPAKPYRTVMTSKTVTPQDHQLDVQLIVDNSNSMLPENQKLASRLQGFVNDLSAAGFDWQMCVTVTSSQKLSQTDPNLYWGASRYWSGVSGTTPWILKASQPNLMQTFQDTINQIGAGWVGTDDERGIKAAWWHVWNGDIRYQDASGCYRKDAGLTTIIISDEDVRSVGGDASREYYPGEYKALEMDDYPQTYINLVKEVFGATKRFSVNSIIVRPGDSACLAAQDAAGAKSHYGYKYNELSTLTEGGVGSICDADYSNQLKYFKDKIVKDMAALPLECAPVNGNVTVTIEPSFNTIVRVENMNLVFEPKIPVGHTIKAGYQCPQ